jgi:glycosyltransferase involved in cell wall biosynthesis
VRIDIIMPAYNAALWIGEAIASVRAQTHTDWRLQIIDDGSTDATAAIAAWFADARIRLIRRPHAGVSAARNHGLAELDADAVLFLDADDRLAPQALASLARALIASPDSVAASGACSIEGRLLRPPGGALLAPLLVRNLFANGGHVLLRAAAARAAGCFRTDLAFGEDWEYWLRVALQGPFAAAPQRAPVLFVRKHPDGAYLRLATDPSAFDRCIEAIFANRALTAHFDTQTLARLRRSCEAERDWIIGRELVRHGRSVAGISRLCHALLTHPDARRALLLACVLALMLLPGRWRGRLRPYLIVAETGL